MPRMRIVGTVLSVASAAQAQPVVTLAKPQVVYTQEFSTVAGVRELSTGALIVLDKRELKVWRLASPTATPLSLGRQGRGPGEYQAPIHLAALPGDSTLVTDAFGDGRVHVVTRDAFAKEALAVRGLRGRALLSSFDVQTDAAGNLYERAQLVRSEQGARVPADSDGVRRVSRSTGRVDTVGRYYALVRSPLFAKPSSTKGSAAREAAPVASGPMPFATRDRFAVAPDGRIAFISADPYRVRVREASGRETLGPPVAYAPLPVDNAVKAAWRAAKAAPVLSLTFDAVVRFAPDGLLWVERQVAPGKPPRFDLFDGKGVLVRQVQLPARARLVGFGQSTVYLARLDADDIERIERYARP